MVSPMHARCLLRHAAGAAVLRLAVAVTLDDAMCLIEGLRELLRPLQAYLKTARTKRADVEPSDPACPPVSSTCP